MGFCGDDWVELRNIMNVQAYLGDIMGLV